jgi:hypothetical protein
MSALRREDSGEAEVRPARSAKWALLLACAGLLLALFAAGLGVVWWVNAVPPPEPDPVVLPVPNGYDAAMAALSKLPPADPGSPVEEYAVAGPGVLRRALAAYRPALDGLRRSFPLEYRTPPSRSSNTLAFPDTSGFFPAARAFSAESRLALLEGQPALAMERALDAVQLGARAGRGGVLAHGLAGQSAISFGVQAAEPCLRHLSRREARLAAERLDRILREAAAEAEVLSEERKLGLANLRHTFRTSATVPVGPSGSPGASQPFRLRLLGWYPRGHIYRTLDSFYRAAIEDARLPYARRPTRPGSDEPFIRVLASHVGSAGRDFAESEARLGLLRAALALQEYRQAHGRFPASLERLAPDVLPRIPIDPFSGRPLLYRVKAGGAILYSVGENGKDDGGDPRRGDVGIQFYHASSGSK